VSRYHAKIQTEDDDIIITDLDSTNGTRVNGGTVAIRRLRAGDQVSIGRTMLLFGNMDEIEARRSGRAAHEHGNGIQTVQVGELEAAASEASRALAVQQLTQPSAWRYRDDEVPPLPMKLGGSQAARLSEVFDYLHRALTSAVENIDANDDGTEVRIAFNEWQTIQAVQLLLARYGRTVVQPEAEQVG